MTDGTDSLVGSATAQSQQVRGTSAGQRRAPTADVRSAASRNGPAHPRLKAVLLMLGVTALVVLISLPSGSGR